MNAKVSSVSALIVRETAQKRHSDEAKSTTLKRLAEAKLPFAITFAVMVLTVFVSHAQTIANGGFEANGLDFTAYPGTVGGSNPAAITDWTASSANVGINGRPAPQQSAFLPNAPITQGTSATFVQGLGSTVSLTQTIAGLTAESPYWITYRENARNGNSGVTSSAQLGGNTIVADHAVASTAVFGLQVSDAYTATGTSATLSLNNTSTTFDNTWVLDDVRIYSVTPHAAPVGMNSSFETNTVTTGQYTSYQFGSDVGGVPRAIWGFSGGGGIVGNGSGYGNPNAPDGTYAGALQNLGSISDAYGTFEAGREYQLTLDVAARSGGGNEFSVTLGGQAILFAGNATYTPTNIGSYLNLTSDFFTVSSAGPKEMKFEGLSTGDKTSFIDNIVVVPVPLPSGTLVTIR